MDLNQLIIGISDYVRKLLRDNLKPDFHFHNLSHTENVVAGAREIGLASGLDHDELVTLMIAAWFHDTGYTEVYNGHEAISVEIFYNYLREIKMHDTFSIKVKGCILATRIPQQPKTLMEQIICDADFHHLSRYDYNLFAQALRKEWENCLNLHYTDIQWISLNLGMLTKHEYFTDYGKNVLQKRKQQNIDQLRQSILPDYNL